MSKSWECIWNANCSFVPVWQILFNLVSLNSAFINLVHPAGSVKWKIVQPGIHFITARIVWRPRENIFSGISFFLLRIQFFWPSESYLKSEINMLLTRSPWTIYFEISVYAHCACSPPINFDRRLLQNLLLNTSAATSFFWWRIGEVNIWTYVP